MPQTPGSRCTCCGELATGYTMAAPAPWYDALAEDPRSVLDDEQCVILDEYFFVRARIVLPVVDTGDVFEWGVWVSLSAPNFRRTAELWTRPERVTEPPCFGWLASELPGYRPSTLNLRTNVHSQPVGVRPLVELEPTSHPLAVEQRRGITRARVAEIAVAVAESGS